MTSAYLRADGPGPGAVIVHERWAGEASTFPALSRARTSNEWAPSARPEYDRGEAQPANVTPSRLHSKVAPGSLVNSNVAELLVVGPLGPAVIWVSGGVVSGVESAAP